MTSNLYRTFENHVRRGRNDSAYQLLTTHPELLKEISKDGPDKAPRGWAKFYGDLAFRSVYGLKGDESRAKFESLVELAKKTGIEAKFIECMVYGRLSLVVQAMG